MAADGPDIRFATDASGAFEELPVGPQRAATWHRPLRLHFQGATISLGKLLPSPGVMSNFTKTAIARYLGQHVTTDWPLDQIEDGPGDAHVFSRCAVEEIGRDIVIVTWLEADETEIWLADELPSHYRMMLLGRAA